MCRCPTTIIFVYIRRNRSHQHKASSRKNNNSDSDGGAKTHSYRTAKFTRIFRTGKFCLLYTSQCLLLQSTQLQLLRLFFCVSSLDHLAALVDY